MNARLKGTLLGIVTAMVGIVVFVGLGMADIISGWASIIMVMGFMVVYSLIAKTDRGPYMYIVGVTVSVVFLIIAEIILIALVCQEHGIDLEFALQHAEIKDAMIQDLIFAFVFVILGVVLGHFQVKRIDKLRKPATDEVKVENN